MRPFGPVGMMVLGFILVVLGVALPFLMVMHVVKTTFLLAFLTYAASMGGLLLGIIGAAMYVRERR